MTQTGSALLAAPCEKWSKVLALSNRPLVKRAKGQRSFLEGSEEGPESDVCALSTEHWQRSTPHVTIA